MVDQVLKTKIHYIESAGILVSGGRKGHLSLGCQVRFFATFFAGEISGKKMCFLLQL